MNDDELNELFGKDDDSEIVENESQDDVLAPSNDEELVTDKEVEKEESKEESEEEIKEVESHIKPEVIKKADKTKEVKKTAVSKKAKESPNTKKNSTKVTPKKETITLPLIKRKIKAWLIKITADTSKKNANKEPKENIPLSQREFLKNFPLSFKATMISLAVLVFVALFVCFLTMPQFRVLNVNIEGNITLSKEEILDEAGIEMNSHLFSNVSGDLIDILKQDYGKIEDRMKAENPYIKDIQISVHFPSTININVTERNKIAYVKMPDGYAAIDEEGTIIELTTIVPDDRSHAVICGLNVSGAVLLEKIVIENESDYQKSLIVLGAIITADINGSKSNEYALFSNVKEVRIIPGGNIFLSIILPSGSELQVKLKDISNINEDMSILRRAIIMDTFEGLPDGSFDMTGSEYIYRKYD